ncbi:hypothetical protein Fleli_0773 [Bernardetia litoralis DSM 6794]|uniref:Uncharacterized protein n=1 Tax=Bernardetia litoralis (strain ATCC 23117 / DSM 6794 / NBRC 15988 / NCIMB 1366 / Fx l1 / Sio-4) TaxID=880071 RepID=I4AGZ8_BERLS|nr:hypothetical protein [Bernardetia litoralis]AFM03233.1 hypothetical protein Fleli_0773 [Bernardetia litoralis DSM 6794]
MRFLTKNFKITFLFLYIYPVLLFNTAFAQQSQSELLKDFTATSLNVFKLTEPKYHKYVFQKVSKPWPITIEKNGNTISKVIINRAGIIEEPYEADLEEHSAYFKDIKHRVVFIDDNFYYIKWSGGKATIKYILSENESVDKDHAKHISKIENYIRRTVAAQSEDRAEIAVEKEKQAAADKIANSLKGKKVKSIAVKWIGNTDKTGHLVKVNYGIEAYLTDGRTLSTSNLGGKMPWDDFKITVKGAEYGQEMITIAQNADVIPNDNVVMTVQSKFLSNIKTTAKLPVHYNEGLHVNFMGENGGIVHLTVSAGYRGNDGKTLQIYVKQVTTANGDKVNQIEIKDVFAGKIVRRLKMNPNATLIINNWGGNGSYGRGSTRGGNGGNGGSVTITKATNVQKFTYVVNNNGGSGGNHEDYNSYDGKRGSKGTIIESFGSVNFNW